MYESSQNKKPSWTPTTVQKKGKSPSKLGHFSIQPQPHHTPAPSQENGEYKRPSGNRITENIIRGFQAKEQELAEGSTVQRKSESPWAPTFEPPTRLPESPASKLKGAFAPVSENQIQRQCAECAREMVEQKGEERKDLEDIGIQTKLTVGAPGDAYEQEADQVAAQVMSMPDNSPHVQKYSEANYTNEIWQRAQSIKPVVQRVVDPSVEMGLMVQRAHQMGGNQPFSQPSSLDANNTHEIWKRAHSIKPVVQRVVDPSVEIGQMVQRAHQMGGNQASGDLESRLIPVNPNNPNQQCRKTTQIIVDAGHDPPIVIEEIIDHNDDLCRIYGKDAVSVYKRPFLQSLLDNEHGITRNTRQELQTMDHLLTCDIKRNRINGCHDKEMFLNALGNGKQKSSKHPQNDNLYYYEYHTENTMNNINVIGGEKKKTAIEGLASNEQEWVEIFRRVVIEAIKKHTFYKDTLFFIAEVDNVQYSGFMNAYFETEDAKPDGGVVVVTIYPHADDFPPVNSDFSNSDL